MTTAKNVFDDPIALEIIWERCISIVDEAADTLVRAAFSTVARESNDYGCVLCDADGVGIGYTTKGTPCMGIILPRTIRAILEKIPVSELQPGDVLFTNDPWYGSGHLPDFDSVSTYGLFAPARTPASIVSRLNQEIVRALAAQDVKDQLLRAGMETVGSSPEEFSSAMKSDMTRMGKVIKDAGIRAN